MENYSLKENSFLKEATNVLNTLYGQNSFSAKKLRVFILPSNENYWAGGANIDNKSITIEISRLHINDENTRKITSMICHEIIHLFYDDNFRKLAFKITKNKEITRLIKEIAASSLFPKGILGAKIYEIKPDDILHYNLPGTHKEDTKEILKKTKLYIKNKKEFDVDFIKFIARLIKKDGGIQLNS